MSTCRRNLVNNGVGIFRTGGCSVQEKWRSLCLKEHDSLQNPYVCSLGILGLAQTIWSEYYSYKWQFSQEAGARKLLKHMFMVPRASHVDSVLRSLSRRFCRRWHARCNPYTCQLFVWDPIALRPLQEYVPLRARVWVHFLWLWWWKFHESVAWRHNGITLKKVWLGDYDGQTSMWDVDNKRWSRVGECHGYDGHVLQDISGNRSWSKMIQHIK